MLYKMMKFWWRVYHRAPFTYTWTSWYNCLWCM